MKIKSIDSLSITECCEQLGLKPEDLRYVAFRTKENPSEREKLVLKRLTILLEADRRTFVSCSTKEHYDNYLSFFPDGIYRNHAERKIAEIIASQRERDEEIKVSQSKRCQRRMNIFRWIFALFLVAILFAKGVVCLIDFIEKNKGEDCQIFDPTDTSQIEEISSSDSISVSLNDDSLTISNEPDTSDELLMSGVSDSIHIRQNSGDVNLNLRDINTVGNEAIDDINVNQNNFIINEESSESIMDEPISDGQVSDVANLKAEKSVVVFGISSDYEYVTVNNDSEKSITVYEDTEWLSVSVTAKNQIKISCTGNNCDPPRNSTVYAFCGEEQISIKVGQDGWIKCKSCGGDGSKFCQGKRMKEADGGVSLIIYENGEHILRRVYTSWVGGKPFLQQEDSACPYCGGDGKTECSECTGVGKIMVKYSQY